MKTIYAIIALICLSTPAFGQNFSSSQSTSSSSSISVTNSYSYSDSRHPIANPIYDRGNLNGNKPLNVPEGGSSLTYLLLAGFTCIGGVWYKRREVRD